MQQSPTPLVKQLYLVFLFNLVLLLFIALQYTSFLENIDGFFLKLYLGITTASHFFLIGILPLLLSLLVFFLTKSNSITKGVHVVLSTFILVVVKFDAVIFEQFRYHISPIVLKLVFGKRSSDIFQFSTTNIVIAVLFIIALFGLQFFFFYLAKKVLLKKSQLKVKITMVGFVLFLLTSHLVYAWSDANYFRPVTQIKNVFPVFYPLTADKLMMNLGLVDLEKARQNEKMQVATTANTVQYPLQPIVSENSSKKNILYLVIDTWRNGYMNPQITPNIYEFSKRCQVYTNHLSGSNMTTGGVFSLMYGIPATYFDTFTGQKIAPVLITELQKQQYQMQILSSSNLENPPFNRNAFANIPNLRLFSKGEKPSERDIEINDIWLNNFDKFDKQKPFFGFLFYDAAHGFDYPKDYPLAVKPSLSEVNYLELDDDYDPTLLINRYKNSLHFIDGLIGKILQQLEEKGVLNNTIIVITSDHGQEFNDNKKGYWQHGGNFSDYQIHVPMMVFDASKAAKTYTQQTLHYDIAPTILQHYLGVKNKAFDYSFGHDLFNPIARTSFICGYNQRFAIIEKKQITNIYPSGLFDVTDQQLNTLDDAHINYDLVSKEMKAMNRFYKMKK
jgi:membrane-anchored protein YejM (alkaline phosphatase superfamily)